MSMILCRVSCGLDNTTDVTTCAGCRSTLGGNRSTHVPAWARSNQQPRSDRRQAVPRRLTGWPSSAHSASPRPD